MKTAVNWPSEFFAIVGCDACTPAHDRNLLRDQGENIPQPGYVGEQYWTKRVLLVGQNPGTPKTLSAEDLPYTAALRRLREQPSNENFDSVSEVLRKFIPRWPVHGNYFPLAECDLSLEEIAYCNVVRCRTRADRPPGVRLVENCRSKHFRRWLSILQPRVVVFIGKWASDQAAAEVAALDIPHAFMNRMRSLSSEERVANRAAVVRLVRESAGGV